MVLFTCDLGELICVYECQYALYMYNDEGSWAGSVNAYAAGGWVVAVVVHTAAALPPVTVKVSADLEVADVMQDVTPEAALPTEVVTPEALLTEVEVDWPVRRLVMYMLVVVIVCQPSLSFIAKNHGAQLFVRGVVLHPRLLVGDVMWEFG